MRAHDIDAATPVTSDSEDEILISPPPRRAGRVARVTLALLVLGLSLAAGVANAALEQGPAAGDLDRELRYVSGDLSRRAGSAAAQPEEYFFTNALFGLASADVAADAPDATLRRREAISDARLALDRIESVRGRGAFTSDLSPQYGAFYAGWSAYLRGSIASIDRADTAIAKRFDEDCAAIASALDASPGPFLVSFAGTTRPTDTFVAVAALGLHDKLGPPKYAATIQRFVESAKKHADPTAGLMPSRVSPGDNAAIEGPRGDSAALVARFAIDIDRAWATALYSSFRSFFVKPLLGAPAVMDHMDSSTVRSIGEVSPFATVLGLAAARAHADDDLARALACTIEGGGFPLTMRGEKRYALERTSRSTALVAFAHATRPATDPTPRPAIVARHWRWPLHALSIAVVLLMWWPLARRVRERRAV